MIEFVEISIRQPLKVAPFIRPITLFTTLVLVAMFIGEGLAKWGIIPYDFFTPLIIREAYYASLFSYVVLKEGLYRWHRRLTWREKRGEWLVVLWFAVLMIFGTIEFFTGGQYECPPSLLEVFVVVQGTFAVSMFSKHIYLRRRWKEATTSETKESKSALVQA